MRTKSYNDIQDQVERIEGNMFPNAFGELTYPGGVRLLRQVMEAGRRYRQNILVHFGLSPETGYNKPEDWRDIQLAASVYAKQTEV